MTILLPFPFPGFTIDRLEIDVEMISAAMNEKMYLSQYVEPDAFLRTQQVVDAKAGLKVEVELVRIGQELHLPGSLRGHSQVSYVCFDPDEAPKFISLDKFKNLLASLPEGTVVRVEFVGKIGFPNHVKYFSTL